MTSMLTNPAHQGVCSGQDRRPDPRYPVGRLLPRGLEPVIERIRPLIARATAGNRIVVVVVCAVAVVTIVAAGLLIAVRSGDTAQATALSLIHISEPTRLGMISYAVF